jgi:4-hydroxy-2-oxoheptanedioate aldolase
LPDALSSPGERSNGGRRDRSLAGYQPSSGPVTKKKLMTKIGLWLSIPEPLIVEAAARAKPDWVGIDLQHGAWDLGTAFRGIQLLDVLETPALVRISEQELELIPRVLDHGASGVVLAMASSAALVEEAVRRARYQPEGVRSFGGQRYGMRPAPDDVSAIRPHVYPMIEDQRGVRDVASIAAVEGISGLHIGPVDLGLGLGLDRDDSRFADALRSIVASGHAAGLPVTMHAVRPDQSRRWLEMGFDELVLTADIELLRTAFATQVAQLRRAALPGAAPASSASV